MPLILEVVSFVDVAACPREDAFPVLVIYLVVSFICVARSNGSRAPPFAFSVFLTLEEVTGIDLSS